MRSITVLNRVEESGWLRRDNDNSVVLRLSVPLRLPHVAIYATRGIFLRIFWVFVAFSWALLYI